MRSQSLVHLSDLHIGVSAAVDSVAAALCQALLAARVDHVVVSGDITHSGRDDELERFRQIFHPLLTAGRMSIVPGNHDRLGDDVRAKITGDRRVWSELGDGLCVVCVDSSGPHNRGWFASHGIVTEQEVEQVLDLLDSAPPDLLKVVAVHHHPLPLPEDSLPERLATRLGSANGSSLALGPELIRRLCGRCDLLLHGHRHVPRSLMLCPNEHPRALRLFNAGSSTELGGARVITHRGRQLLGDPFWIAAQLDRHQDHGKVHGKVHGKLRASSSVWNTVRAFGLV